MKLYFYFILFKKKFDFICGLKKSLYICNVIKKQKQKTK